ERGDVERDARAERETDAASRIPLRERVSRAAAQLDRTAPSSLDAGVEDAAADSRAHLADEGPRAEVVRRVCARVQRQLEANVACWNRRRLDEHAVRGHERLQRIRRPRHAGPDDVIADAVQAEADGKRADP